MSENFNPLLRRFRNRGWEYQPGDVYYVDADGIWQTVSRPSDWATVPYFFGIDQATGFPAWLSLGGEVSSIVRGAFIAASTTLFPPSVARVVTLPSIGPDTVLYPPALASIGVPFLASTAQLFPPTILPEQAVTGGTIAAGTTLFAPTVSGALGITGAFISGTQLFAPTVAAEVSAEDNWEVLAHASAPTDGIFDLTGFDIGDWQAIVVEMDEIRIDLDAGRTDASIQGNLYIDGVLLGDGYNPWRHIATKTNGDTSDTSGTTVRGWRLLGGVTNTYTMDEDTGASFGGRLEIANANSPTLHKTMFGSLIWMTNAGHACPAALVGLVSATGRITGFMISCDMGVLTSGTVTIYGVPGPAAREPYVPPADVVSLYVGALS